MVSADHTEDAVAAIARVLAGLCRRAGTAGRAHPGPVTGDPLPRPPAMAGRGSRAPAAFRDPARRAAAQPAGPRLAQAGRRRWPIHPARFPAGGLAMTQRCYLPGGSRLRQLEILDEYRDDG